MKCPYCKSINIVNNGYAPSKKTRWKCNKCNKTFSKDSGKGYPPTSVDFRFINFILYWCQNEPLDKAVIRINRSLRLYKMSGVDVYRKDKVSRATVHKWRAKRDEYLRFFSEEEAICYYQSVVDKMIHPSKELVVPEEKLEIIEVEEEEVIPGVQSHLDGIGLLKMLLSEEEFKDLIHDQVKLRRIIKGFKDNFTLKFKVKKLRSH